MSCVFVYITAVSLLNETGFHSNYSCKYFAVFVMYIWFANLEMRYSINDIK